MYQNWSKRVSRKKGHLRNSIIIIIHLQTVQSLVQHPNTFINIKMKWNVDLYYCFLDILANNYRRNKKQTAVISIQGNINASSRVVFKASCWDHQAQVKLNLHCMTGKLCTLNLIRVSITYLLHIMSCKQVTTWNGTISKFWQEDGQTPIAR